MRSSKDYTMLVHLLNGRPTHQATVCATDAIDAHSQCWFKIDTADHKHVDTFEIVTIEVCAHQKGRVV